MSSNQNPIIGYDASYVGLYYALSATGGYQIEEGLKTITMLPVNQINQYDVTDSLQVMFDVRIFNESIGLYKDSNNQNIISTSFDPNTYKFPLDVIQLTSSQFVLGMQSSQVISIGKLSYVYSDFITYINEYFGHINGFSTLFTLSSQVDINAGLFDANEFVNVINGKTLNPLTGEYIKDLSGSIILNYTNELLNYVTYSNPFNNRNPFDNNGNSFSIQDGFIEGDIIFIPNGITITLNLDVISNQITLNPLGYLQLAQLNASTNSVNGYFSVNTTTTNTNIKRVVKAPLLIKLMNLS
jgi:hypothetical protein